MQGYRPGRETARGNQDRAEAAQKFQAPVPFTRTSGIRPFVDYLNAMGAPVDRFLGQARIPVALLEEAEGLVPLRFAYRLAEFAVEAEGIEHLGLAVAERTSAYDLGIFGELLRQATTVYDYLQTGIRLVGSVTSGARFWLTREGDQVRFHQYSAGKACLGRCHADMYTLAITLRMLRSFTQNQWSPGQVCLLAGINGLPNSGSEVFGDAEIVTGRSHSSFTIPVALLQRPIPSQPSATPLCNGLSAPIQPPVPKDLVSSIEEVVTALLRDGYPKIRVAAEAAGMSPRTLQRRLGDVGFSYSRLVNRARMRLGAEWLADTAMPVSEIAFALGYGDPANFTRAFRHKTGCTPQRYRTQIGRSPNQPL